MTPGFSVTWDHDTLYLWCSECSNGTSEDDIWCDFGNPTPVTDITDAIKAHMTHHREGSDGR
jgi:hypothetical protein